MPSPVKPRRPTKKQQAAMDAAYAARQQVLAARQSRDDITPAWLQHLRAYIDAAIAHQLAEGDRDSEGYAISDPAGREQCEEVWSQVIAALGPSVQNGAEAIPGKKRR